MGPSPSWTPLSNQRLMVAYPSLCTGNSHIQTSTYSGIAIITSQPNSVQSIPSPIGPKQCAAGLSCSNKKWTTLGRLSLNGKYPKWALDKVEKRLNKSTSETIDGANNQGTTVLSLMKSKLKVTLSYPTHKVLVKSSRRSVVDMAFKLTSKVAAPSRTSWSPPRTKTLWSTKVMPYIGTNVVT